jgi:hypothetical protein
MLHYLETLTREARRRFDAGLSAEEASFDIALSEFELWLDAERVCVNVHTLYREFRGATGPADILAMFAGMARVQARRGRR